MVGHLQVPWELRRSEILLCLGKTLHTTAKNEVSGIKITALNSYPSTAYTM